MHIPDGFLSLPVAAVLWLLAALAVGVALRRQRAVLGDQQAPLMGVLAACIFAGQMLNFAVAGGTSGHLMGAALATILVGPWAAILLLACVVGAQALLFQDGGLLALGANVFNMGVIGALSAGAVYGLVRRVGGGRRGALLLGGLLSGWVSIVVSALAVALELALSGTTTASLALPAMAGVHALIGIGEGLITMGALAVVYAARRDLLIADAKPRLADRAALIIGLLLAVGLAVMSPLASADPDGLEAVAASLGFHEQARPSALQVFGDYAIPGIADGGLSTVLAGALGAAAAAGLAYLLLRRRPSGEGSRAPARGLAHDLDPYLPGDSPVHRLDARVKLAGAMAFILCVAVLPSGAWPASLALLSGVLFIIALSAIGLRVALRRSALALPFALAAAPLLFIGGAPGVALPEPLAGVVISLPGLTRFASIALKSWTSALMAITLASVTPFPEILRALRALHVPRQLVSVFGLMWRYLFVLVDEAQRMMVARAARSGISPEGGRPGGGGLLWRARVTGAMAGSLFLRAIERGDRIYLAMAARGYDGEIRAFPPSRVPGWQLGALAFVLVGLIGLAVLAIR